MPQRSGSVWAIKSAEDPGYFKGGYFWIFFTVLYSTLLHLPPLRPTRNVWYTLMSEDTGIEPRTAATTPLAVRHCIATWLDLIWDVYPGSRIREFKYFNPENCSKALGNMIRVIHPKSGSGSWFLPIPDPGVRKTSDPGSGSVWALKLSFLTWTASLLNLSKSVLRLSSCLLSLAEARFRSAFSDWTMAYFDCRANS